MLAIRKTPSKIILVSQCHELQEFARMRQFMAGIPVNVP
jgi:hypothetical protein